MAVGALWINVCRVRRAPERGSAWYGVHDVEVPAKASGVDSSLCRIANKLFLTEKKRKKKNQPHERPLVQPGASSSERVATSRRQRAAVAVIVELYWLWPAPSDGWSEAWWDRPS